MWPEIEQAKSENKRELKLNGADISERINADGIDTSLFALDSLNLLNISDTTLKSIPAEIGSLKNLQTILFFGNEITSIPDSIGQLDKLKVLDLSRNMLESLPNSITQLKQLTTINISNNKLTEFPALLDFAKLLVIDLSGNQLNTFPDICSDTNSNLSEIYLKENLIEEIPFEIDQLTSLKHFSMAKNSVKKLPKNLVNITKLKDLDMAENPIADKRLLKLIQQCRTKQILDYVKQHGENAPKESSENGSKKSEKAKKSKKQQIADVPKHKFNVKRHNEDTVKIIYEDCVKTIRPFVLYCIVENVDLNGNELRKFLQIQTKLHETVCGKREKSTIATHDLAKLPEGEKVLRYTAKDPKHLKIHPLGKMKKYTALKLYNDLKAEADALRKEKKRNVYSGIHKYLYLLEGKEQFSCIEDIAGNVISLPPLTNGDLTKISPETTQILIEVTSSTSMNDCLSTMEELLKAMLFAGFGVNSNPSDEIANVLDLKQVKITDPEGNLRRVYPAKGDLALENDENIIVYRE